MFEPFSSGYYLGRLYVEPHEGDRPVMGRWSHEQVNRQLYTTGTGVERVDAPLVMKLGRTHLAVHGDENVAEGVLAVPETLIDDRIDNPPDLREVLLAKSDRATQLIQSGLAVGL